MTFPDLAVWATAQTVMPRHTRTCREHLAAEHLAAEHLAAEHLAAAYRGARAFVAALNDVPPYAVRESAELRECRAGQGVVGQGYGPVLLS